MRVLCLTLACAITACAADWPQFRGPNGSAVSEDSKLPTEWAKDKNVAWKKALPGYGWSCPVVAGDKVFVTTAVSDKQRKPSGGMGGGGFGGGGGGKGGFGRQEPPDDVYKFQVICLNAADGKILWTSTARESKPTIPTQGSNTYATETPVTDGERVYAYFGMHGLYAFDFAGKEVWKLDLGSYPMAMGFGTGSSPALADGKVIVQCDNERESFLVAVDTKTGKEAWRTKRTERTAYSSPLVWKNKMRTEIVCMGSQKVRSYAVATGKELWELGGMSGQPKATPVATDDLLIVGTGGGPGGMGGGGFGGPKGGPGGAPGGGKGGFGGGNKPMFAVKPGASGDITLKDGAKSSDAIAWTLPQAGPQTPSPLIYQGHVYVLDERGGSLTCYDAKTGKQAYKERVGGRGFTSSPWAYDGKIFCLDDSGTTHVVEAGPTFKAVGKNELEGMCWSSPAVGNGSVFLRTVDQLYCLRKAD
ncbi:MAG TPA: PQQ-binding-like beta-propeller repeat protein [Gemmataceae bacterium]|jgi:outer membrane protein assembly factor BamB|nr:PQQ-binding-like beta-propeller repeat protein [Gemmataceae bacterium]